MSGARASMTHRCLIERDASRLTSADPYGQPEAARWEGHLTNLPCRWWYEGSKTVVGDGTQKEVSTRKLIVPLGTDVTADDRIAWVHDQRGRTVADGPMRIDEIGNRADHVVLKMIEVR